jgi:DNA-binding transcriptional MerR regulator
MIEDVRDEEPVGIGAVAERLGVTTSTLRSWERRYNLTRPERTAGAHRRYTAADLATLTAMRQLVAHGMPAAQAAALVAPGDAPGPGPAELGSRLREAADALDAGHVSAILHGALLRYGTPVTWDQILVPLLTELGGRWRDHGCDVDREHVLSDTAEVVLRSHAQHTLTGRRPAAGDPVLLVAAPGERHTLPLAALAAALAEQATPAVLLADLPPADLAHALGQLRPRAAVLWSQTPRTAGPGPLRALREASPAVYAAGPGWDTADLPTPVPHLATLTSAVGALQARTADGGGLSQDLA